MYGAAEDNDRLFKRLERELAEARVIAPAPHPSPSLLRATLLWRAGWPRAQELQTALYKLAASRGGHDSPRRRHRGRRGMGNRAEACGPTWAFGVGACCRYN
jgi:hypothetical protein